MSQHCVAWVGGGLDRYKAVSGSLPLPILRIVGQPGFLLIDGGDLVEQLAKPVP